jgi:sugar phosphate isomerase/epimerase
MRELGINLRAVGELTTEEYVKEIAALGFTRTFSGTTTPEKMAETERIVHAAGLAFDQLHAPFDGINNMWSAGEEGDVMYKRLTDAIDCCVALDAPIATVHLSSGWTPPMINDIGRGRYISLVEYAAKRGVKIAFENQRKLYNIAWAFEEFKDAENVGFCWDTGHEACATPDIEFMPLFGKRLICTHVQDNNAVFNEDLHILPFDGKVNFERVAMWLNKYGYKGSLMLEVGNSNEIYKDLTPTAFLARAYDAVCRVRRLTDGE